ncbi:MAG: hypothetical protein VYD08_03025 [Pseudomonadota bacterium]|nr:hypothetical protein [Pseudomonadota bacterium]
MKRAQTRVNAALGASNRSRCMANAQHMATRVNAVRGASKGGRFMAHMQQTGIEGIMMRIQARRTFNKARGRASTQREAH